MFQVNFFNSCTKRQKNLHFHGIYSETDLIKLREKNKKSKKSEINQSPNKSPWKQVVYYKLSPSCVPKWTPS